MTIEQFREWVGRYLLPVLVPALAAVFYFYDPSQSRHGNFFLKCLFHQATGLHCPGCGGQRAVHQLLHGHVRQAANHNLLFVVALPFLAVMLAIRIANGFRSEKITCTFLLNPVAKMILLAAVMGFWLARNLKTPFTEWLAP